MATDLPRAPRLAALDIVSAAMSRTGDFHRRFQRESRTTPYPLAEIARLGRPDGGGP